MKRKLITPLVLFITFAMFLSNAWCYTNIIVLDRTPWAYERVTVTDAAVSRLSADYRSASGAVFITIEDNNIRYRIDGGDPSATDGHLVVASAYQNIWLTDRRAIRDFRMIGIGGDAIVIITYYRSTR